MTLCKNDNDNIIIYHYLFNNNDNYQSYQLAYINNQYKLSGTRQYSCKNCQTIEIVDNDVSYIITCFYVTNYGITCVSDIILEKLFVLNRERVIGICSSYKENEPNIKDKKILQSIKNQTISFFCEFFSHRRPGEEFLSRVNYILKYSYNLKKLLKDDKKKN
jgi:hypothetical protein